MEGPTLFRIEMNTQNKQTKLWTTTNENDAMDGVCNFI